MMITIDEGDSIISTRLLEDSRIKHWKYGKECQNHGGSFMPGTKFKVVELNKSPGNMWVKAEIPGSDPAQYIKITGEEFANNFES